MSNNNNRVKGEKKKEKKKAMSLKKRKGKKIKTIIDHMGGLVGENWKYLTKVKFGQ